jgi:hypothetical protein
MFQINLIYLKKSSPKLHSYTDHTATRKYITLRQIFTPFSKKKTHLLSQLPPQGHTLHLVITLALNSRHTLYYSWHHHHNLNTLEPPNMKHICLLYNQDIGPIGSKIGLQVTCENNRNKKARQLLSDTTFLVELFVRRIFLIPASAVADIF